MITRFNMYCGFSITPKAGDCSLYLKHVLDHICQGDRLVFDYVMAWMASGVQQPGNPARIALSLRGKPGVGKGIFATEYGHIFGRHFLHLTNRAHVTGRFNAHSAEAVLIFADEALFVGDARDTDIIKTLISETTKMLERKGIDAVPVRNYGRFIFATNHDHALRIDVHDRRTCALHVTIPDSMIGAAGAKMRRDYFVPILEQMKNGGRAALLHYLLQYDLKNFNPEAIPQTEELAKQKLLSAHPGDQFIISLAQDGFLPGGLLAQPWIARAHMESDRGGLLDHMKRRSGRTLEHATDNVLSEILKRWGFEKKHLKDGSAWIAPNLNVLRAKIKETYPAVTWPDNETQWGLAE